MSLITPERAAELLALLPAPVAEWVERTDPRLDLIAGPAQDSVSPVCVALYGYRVSRVTGKPFMYDFYWAQNVGEKHEKAAEFNAVFSRMGRLFPGFEQHGITVQERGL